MFTCALSRLKYVNCVLSPFSGWIGEGIKGLGLVGVAAPRFPKGGTFVRLKAGVTKK